MNDPWFQQLEVQVGRQTSQILLFSLHIWRTAVWDWIKLMVNLNLKLTPNRKKPLESALHVG